MKNSWPLAGWTAYSTANGLVFTPLKQKLQPATAALAMPWCCLLSPCSLHLSLVHVALANAVHVCSCSICIPSLSLSRARWIWHEYASPQLANWGHLESFWGVLTYLVANLCMTQWRWSWLSDEQGETSLIGGCLPRESSQFLRVHHDAGIILCT